MSRIRPGRKALRTTLSLLLVWGLVLPPIPVRALEGDAPAPERPAASSIRVNRTVPTVQPVPSSPHFSARPTPEELSRARVFSEPLVPTGRASASENQALVSALRAYLSGRTKEDFTPLEHFLRRYPGSPWRMSLLTNLGIAYREAGYFSRALEAWEEAWRLGRDEREAGARAMAERAFVELLELNMLLGRQQVLKRLLGEVEGRELGGSASEKLLWARQGLWLFENEHERAIPSGPTALDRILAYENPRYTPHPKLEAFHATPDGASLVQMRKLAGEVGLKLRMAYREVDDELPLPAVVHLKVGHFSAVVKEEGGRYLLHDPILGGEIWLSRRALREESSGYFLIPAGGKDVAQALPGGWRQVKTEEGARIRGKCAPCAPPDPGAYRRCDGTTGCGDGSCGGMGLAVYSFHLLLANLTLNDTPLGYLPPRGPAVRFQVTYNHRESFQPAVFSYGNLGPKWTFDWLSYVEDNPANLTAAVTLYARGGGQERYSGFNEASQSYEPHVDSRAVLVRTSVSPIRYERRLADGSVEVFAQADGASTSPRRVFMTESRDPQGQTLTFTHDSSLRLVAATDAIGQVTTLSYENPSDPLKITRVTDPFGRSATFEYTGGRLTRIRDVIGLESGFQYAEGDFIHALTTPYGTTRFAHGVAGPIRWVEATDPLGGKERLEYHFFGTGGVPATEPAASVPEGFSAHNVGLGDRLTVYWDKRAWMLHPGDASKALQIHWLRDDARNVITGTPHSEKRALENRVWYAYPGQNNPSNEGTHARPSGVARVLDDGQTQLYRYENNSKGKVTRGIDPIGRETVYEYDTNGIDLLKILQKSGSAHELLWSATYNDQHLPLTMTDAAGQTTAFTYNAAGQVLTIVTPPSGGLGQAQRTTTNTYDTNGYLRSITGPLSEQESHFTYDGHGRVRTETDPDSYTLTYDYDALDRPTRVTYPDGTFTEIVYNRLDAEKLRDRQGRWIHTFHDALRRPVATRDPLGRTTTQQWCPCGNLEKIVDPNGNATSWEWDVQGRVTREINPEGKDRLFFYERTTSRMKQVHDSLTSRQIKTYDYFLDGSLKQVAYSNTGIATPTVSYTYDPVYRRIATMTDGTGTTTYGYYPVTASPTPGAGRLASVDGPLANDTITYAYDEPGRIVSRGLSGRSTTFSHDAFGRVRVLGSPAGDFTYTYEGATGRPLSLRYPNGQVTNYRYFDNGGDRRLREIEHLSPTGEPLSKQNYTYETVGRIKTWTQQYGTAPAKRYDFEYDAADQLTVATLESTDLTPALLKRYDYGYDDAGNRTSEQVDDSVSAAAFDSQNQLMSRQPGGALRFAGAVNEPAGVTAGGLAATVASDNTFDAQVPVFSGTSRVAVVATDPSGNTRTNTYQVNQSGPTTNYSYDANGNLTSDGTRTYEWDAANRLVRILQGTTELARFTYDGIGRRRQKIAGGVTHTYVYDASNIVQERLSTGTTIDYIHGPEIDQPLARRESSGTVTYYLADHLGSVVQETSASGEVSLTREYDPYGNHLRGGATSGYAFTGREHDAETGLYYYRARYYDPKVGRFLGEDPIGFAGGANFYTYVGSSPTNYTDPEGLAARPGVDLGKATDMLVWRWTMLQECALRVRAEEDAAAFARLADAQRRNLDRGGGWRYAHCMAACRTRKECGALQTEVRVGGWIVELIQLKECAFEPGNDCHSAFGFTDDDDNELGYSCPQEMECAVQCWKLKDKDKEEKDKGPIYQFNGWLRYKVWMARPPALF